MLRMRSLLSILFLAFFGFALVLATTEIQPEGCFRCPSSVSVDDATCGTGLNRFYYYGNWEHCKQGCTPNDYLCTESSTCDCKAYAKLTFVGNRIRLYAAVGPWGGEACVKIDYQNPQTAYFCSDQCEGNKLVFDSGLLPYGRHTILISNESQPGKKITIDRVEITRYPNLIQNPSFEEKCPTSCPYSEENFPPRWTADSERSPVTLRWDCEVAHTGTKSFFISSECPNDAFVFQNVHVRRHTRCLISAWIKTNDVECGAGANVSPLTSIPPLSCIHSCGLFGCNDWTQRSITFDTCENDVIAVAGRLGFFNDYSTGCAWFDDFEFICEDI